VNVTIGLRPGESPERDPLLFCAEHWERISWHRRAWAVVWAAGAVQDDRRLAASLGLLAGSRISRAQLAKALGEQPACCRLGSRAEYLMK
jgi:hypothetical protein